MRKLLLLVLAPAAVLLLACPPAETPKVATIPADVTAVDASAPLAIAPATPAEDRDEAIAGGEELPSGDEAVGKAAPGFTLDSALTRGAKVRLLRNKVTIVHFWATWCAPCKKSFDDLQKLHEKYEARGLVVVGLSVDDEERGVAEFAKQLNARFAIAWDPDHKIANLYKPSTMPSTYIIDRSGIVKHVLDGYHDGERREIETAIIPLL